MDENEELTNILNIEEFKADYSILNNEEMFLKNIYNLNDFESCMLYINNNEYLSIFTINRILLLMLNCYINDNYFPNDEFLEKMIKCLKTINNIKTNKKELLKIIMEYKHTDKKIDIIQNLKKNNNK
jgi:hypothetical protein